MAFVADNSVVIAWLTDSQATAYTRQLLMRTTREAVHVPAVLLEVARRAGLSAYDASYLELAARRGWPLATRDRSLQRAAQRVGVALA